MGRGYLTPDTIPASTTCRVLFIPDSVDWVAQVLGAVEELTFSESWTPFGAVTPEDAAAAAGIMFDLLSRNVRGCRMVGEIILWAGSAAPDDANLLLCDGTHLSSDDYPDLFAVIGTTYGSSGAGDFALPDLRGKVAIGENGSHSLGSSGGSETVTLTESEMPSHSHVDVGHTHALAGEFPGLALAPGELPVDVPGSGEFTLPGSANLLNTGGGGAHNNMQPYLTLNYYIQAV